MIDIDEHSLDGGKLALPTGLDTILDQLIEGGGVHEQDFWWFRNMRPEDSLFIDIGSNIGNSAISISNACPGATIYGFEPNRMLEPYLSRAASFNPKFTFSLFGLTSETSELELFVPIVDSVIIAGESSTDLEHFEEAVVNDRLRRYSAKGQFSVAKLLCRFERLDDQHHLFQVAEQKIWKVIKIDTEGSELKALKGGIGFIDRFRPTIMVENGERPEICALLGDFGYSRYLYEQNSGGLSEAKGQAALNSLFVYRAL